jgi:hypothetical protein
MDITETYDTDPMIFSTTKFRIDQKPTIAIDSIAKRITLHYTLIRCSDNTSISRSTSIAFGGKIEETFHKNCYLSMNSVVQQNRDDANNNNQVQTQDE